MVLCVYNYDVSCAGDAFFMGPNGPHAYISGDILECMALSDNTVRAGLSPKHKDVDTLLAMLEYTGEAAGSHFMVPQQLSPYTLLYRQVCKYARLSQTFAGSLLILCFDISSSNITLRCAFVVLTFICLSSTTLLCFHLISDHLRIYAVSLKSKKQNSLRRRHTHQQCRPAVPSCL